MPSSARSKDGRLHKGRVCVRRQDEGCWAERPAKLEHPSSAFAALRHLLPQGEKEEPLHCHGQSPPFEINRSADIAPLLLPLVGEGGRAGAKRRRGRMRGAGRSAARQAGAPLIRLRCAQAPSPTGGGPPPGRRGNRFIATANHHRSRLTEALLSRLSFSPLWEKVAEPERSAGEVG